MSRERRRICVVTGTRAEFGLLRSTLQAIGEHPKLLLQLIVTGMHLDASRGHTIDQVRAQGWQIDRVVPWPAQKRPKDPQTHVAQCTGRAIAGLAAAFAELRSDVVLVVGDRAEVFAAASAAHLGGRLLAHIHGGDRAQGVVDDALRHAITKLAHIHFPATRESAARIRRLGEQAWRIHRVGSPGLDDIHLGQPAAAWSTRFRKLNPRRYAMVIVHPEMPDLRSSERLAETIFQAVRSSGVEQVLAIAPNNDPGSAGIMRFWERASQRDTNLTLVSDLSRHTFLGLLRDAAVLVGNSSAGIIEAASFGTPVVDVGSRQLGRERGTNVKSVPIKPRAIQSAVEAIWRGGKPIRCSGKNCYGSGGAGEAIAQILSSIDLSRHVPKLIAY